MTAILNELKEAITHGDIRYFDLRGQHSAINQSIGIETSEACYELIEQKNGAYTVLKNGEEIKEISGNKEQVKMLLDIAKLKYCLNKKINSLEENKNLSIKEFRSQHMLSYAIDDFGIEVVKNDDDVYKIYVDGKHNEILSQETSKSYFLKIQQLHDAPYIQAGKELANKGIFSDVQRSGTERKPNFYYLLESPNKQTWMHLEQREGCYYGTVSVLNPSNGKSKSSKLPQQQVKDLFTTVQNRKIQEENEKITSLMQECQLVYHNFGQEERDILIKDGTAHLTSTIKEHTGYTLVDKEGNEKMRIIHNKECDENTPTYFLQLYDNEKGVFRRAVMQEKEVEGIYKQCKNRAAYEAYCAVNGKGKQNPRG